MPPKKREKEPEVMKITPKIEETNNDKELFLQAFEKPTQIYRFLRTRNLVSPLFLPRSLSYMRQRMSRNHKSRKNFDLNGMLKKTENKAKLDIKGNGLTDFMTLTFTAFDDKNKHDYSSVTAEAYLLHYCHKKRKDISSPITHSLIGKCDVPCTSHLTNDNNHKKSTEAISIAADSLRIANHGYLFKSCILLLKITTISHKNSTFNHISNPPAKRLRKDTVKEEEESGGEKKRTFAAELVVSDRHKKCLLTNGDYELILREYKSKPANPQCSTWETIDDPHATYVTSSFEMFEGMPVLKFQLKWNSKPVNGKVNMPCPIALRDARETRNGFRSNKFKSSLSAPVKEDKKEPEKKMRIFYQFLYNKNSRQQTEAREDMHCPWCSLNCMSLYSLLKHLKLCHSRFVFSYTPHSQGARIDVAISECFDGSYSGSPHDLHSLTGFAFTRTGPVRRIPVTNVIVCRPKRQQNSLSEFLEVDETVDDGPPTYVIGHNRLYYHTGSCLPIRPQEIDNDSEGENDPQWLKIKTKRMIDDFTDVNEGEKELMKLWNLHVMHYNFIGDCQIGLACQSFVHHNGTQIWHKNLYYNFVLHLCNLHDFGLISAALIYKNISSLLAMRGQKAIGPS